MAIVIYPPTIDWSYMRQRPQNLMFEFARNGHLVFYCNIHESKEKCLERVAKNLIVVHNWHIFKEKFLPAVRASGAPVIIWCSWALLANTMEDFQPGFIVYDCLDEFADWLPYEPEMVKVADLIFCTSDHLMQRMVSQYPEKEVFLLNNGCDYTMFSMDNISVPARPPDLPDSTRARIGYIGAWARWVDKELVEKVCAAFPEHQVVVIGPKLDQDLPRGYPNLIYLGLKPYEQLPVYLSFLDTCIIPFKINETTRATNPIKVYEYMAAGKKIVSTALPELIKLEPLVRVGSSHAEFLEHIRTSFAAGDENLIQRKSFAEDNSWHRRYLQSEQVLSDEVAGFREPVIYVKESQVSSDRSFHCCYPAAAATISNLGPTFSMKSYPAYIGRKGKNIFRYLIKFDLREFSGDIKRAVLILFIEKCDSPDKLKSIELRKITGPWNERSVSWRTRPETGLKLVESALFKKTSGWLEWDITLSVKEWVIDPTVNFGVELKGTKETLPFLVHGVNLQREDYFSPKLKVYL